MLCRLAILFVPFIAFAQNPPKKVDEALRTRVTNFLQDHVDGNFRKAFEYVAEDTKDYYFSAPKTKYKSFHIDQIDYSDSFTKAAVRTTVESSWVFYGHVIPVTTPIVFNWIIEDGQWRWHYDPVNGAATPMGKSDPDTLKSHPNAAAASAGKLTPDAIAAKAQEILGQSSIDKSEVAFAAGKASSDQVVFHNGYPGSVRVVLDPGPSLAGFHVQLDKSDLRAGEDAVVKLSYDPADSPPKSPVNVRLTIEPFNRVFNVTVKFEAPAQ